MQAKQMSMSISQGIPIIFTNNALDSSQPLLYCVTVSL